MVWQTSQAAVGNVGWRAEKQLIWYVKGSRGRNARDFQLRVANQVTT